MVMEAPIIIEIKVINDPIASVEIPVTPCPIVHPRDNTPPIPISVPPIRCLIKSCLEANHSTLKLCVKIAYMNDPKITDNSAVTPNVK